MNYLILIPVVFQIVRQIEQLMPASSGKDKLDAALKMAEGIFGDIQTMLPQITPLVNTAVSLLNLAGVFQRKK